MTIRISELSPQEIEAADALVILYKKLAALDTASRMRVYKRWDMLKLIQPGDVKKWERELERVAR